MNNNTIPSSANSPPTNILSNRISYAQDPSHSSKGLEYKNLIKEKILKPSKLQEYQQLRKHHSHLVIRDSNYFNKTPSSFIACAHCHRGRVLKLCSIEESTTNEILNEIYSTIGENPCSKKRGKANAKTTPKPTSSELDPSGSTSSTNEHKKVKSSSIPLQQNMNISHGIIPFSVMTNPPSISKASHSSSSITTTNSVNSGTGVMSIPSFSDFFENFDQLSSLPNINMKIPITSINSLTTVSTSTLSSIMKGASNLPTLLDLFLSLSISKNYPEFISNNDILIIPLPVISNTRFSTTMDESIYLSDLDLCASINSKIDKFITMRSSLNNNQFPVNNFKIIVIVCAFQEGSPSNPQEDQSHKYVGKILLLSDFIVNEMTNQLLYQTRKFFLNHDYTYIDPKFEWLQAQCLQKLVISPFQKQLHMKYNYPVIGGLISSDVFLNTTMSINVPFIMNSSYLQVNQSTSLYIVCYLVLTLLKRLNIMVNLDEMNLMNSLQGIEYNNEFNIYILKLVLDNLREITTNFTNHPSNLHSFNQAQNVQTINQAYHH